MYLKKYKFLTKKGECWLQALSIDPFLLQAEAFNFIKKESLARVFSFEFCEISKNTFSYRTPPVAASECK